MSHNVISDTVAAGVELTDHEVLPGATSATIVVNTFISTTTGIRLLDNQPNDVDGKTVTATIGGAPADANFFINNTGGSLGDSSYLLELIGIPTPVTAENNNWGLCTVGQIEQEILHKPDDSSLGLVDFVPFIATNCTTDSPTPTPSPTPSLTPSPTEAPSRTWGDIDCSGIMTALDALKLILGFLELPYDRPQTCPEVLQDVIISGGQAWGDVNCEDGVDVQDALDVLATVAGTPREIVGCPVIGEPVGVATG